MEKSDFKQIKKEYFESCREIIKLDGECDNIECFNCPFWSHNWNRRCYEDDAIENLAEYSKKFIEKFENI